ncbi:MAG: hypothetical protein ACKERG_00245 [Candidatus Hodgkinia cicadicola]
MKIRTNSFVQDEGAGEKRCVCGWMKGVGSEVCEWFRSVSCVSRS